MLHSLVSSKFANTHVTSSETAHHKNHTNQCRYDDCNNLPISLRLLSVKVTVLWSHASTWVWYHNIDISLWHVILWVRWPVIDRARYEVRVYCSLYVRNKMEVWIMVGVYGQCIRLMASVSTNKSTWLAWRRLIIITIINMRCLLCCLETW